MKNTKWLLLAGILALTQPLGFAADLEDDTVTVNKTLSIYQGGPWNVGSAVVGHWHLDDNSANTTVADSSSEGNTGTLNGGDNTEDIHISGKIGTGAFDMDGVSDVVTCGSDSSLTTNGSFAVSLWLNVDDFSICDQSRALIKSRNSGGVGYQIIVDNASSGTVYCVRNDGTETVKAITSLESVHEDTWTHVLFNWDGTNIAIYLDGIENSESTAASSFAFDSTDDLLFGGRASTNTYQGGLDEIMICNRSLSLVEVRGIYNRGQGTNTTSGVSASATFTQATEFEDGLKVPALGDFGMGSFTNSL